MKIIFTLLLLLIISVSVAINMEVSGNSIMITGNFDTLDLSEKSSENHTFTHIKINDCVTSGRIGEPELPVYSRFINLPNQGNYILDKILYDERIIDIDHAILPSGFSVESELISAEYQRDEWLPSNIVSISDPNIMGAYRFSQVVVSPIQYNPVKKKIRILENFQIELILDETDTKNPKTRQNKINSFSKIAGSILNENLINRSEQNGKYLFIVQDNIASLLDPLLRWKEKLGYKTRVATISETGNTSSAIKNFIQNAYDNWEIPPEYVVLVGDVDGSIVVPAFYVEGYYTPWDVSDHSYSLLEGDDYFPDLFVGRFSIRSQMELNTIISKIINYESDPLIEDDWQNKALMTGVVVDWWNYYSGRETVMECRDKLLDFEFTVVDTFITPYQNNMSTLINMINGGYTFVNYRGYGGPEYWWGNYGDLFNINGINSLSNGFKLPMVTGIVCGGADFASSSYPSCFGETWLKAGSPTSPKGAIGFIGPSEHDTKTWFNNTIDMGIYHGITQEGITRCGEMMLSGKMAAYNNFPYCHAWGNSLNSDQFYFYVYNLLGDPGLQVLTDTPEVFEMTFQEEISSGSNFIEVQIDIGEREKSGFTIAITNSDSLVTIGISNELGIANIPIELVAGTYEITASKYQLIPVTTELTVVDEDIVRLDEYTCSDIVSGEIVNISTTIQNSSNIMANNLEFEISSGDEFITIISGLNTLTSLAVGEFTTCNFEIELDNLWRDGIQGEIFLNILSDIGENTFYMPVEITSPQFTISNLIVDGHNGYMMQNSSSSFDLELLNSGNYDAGETTIELIAVSDNYTILNNNTTCSSLLMEETGLTESSFEIEVNDAISGELAKFKFEISNNGDVVQEIEYSYPIGIICEESPTFCDQGYIAIESSDVGNFSAPVYDWIEIDPSYGGQGTVVQGGHVTGDDGFTKTLNLPFDFQYFGIIYEKISVCSNGWISMGETDLVFFRNKNIPSGVGSKAMIAPFWDNLTNCSIYSHYDATENIFIIEWSNCRNYNSYSFETFQVIFYDPIYYPSINGNGDILFQYKVIYNNDYSNNYATIGIENETQTDGLLITFANIYPPTVHTIESETAILFTSNEESYVYEENGLIINSPKLYQNYPNPFNPITIISFSLTTDISENTELIIYNIKGQKIKKLEIRNLKLGINNVVWNGTDNNDRPVSSGVYFYKLVAGNKTIATRKCLLLK
ncbi:MAG: T9SS type A sorting domain-containing protein [Candidatus Cloacimonetes bacterium]|nr:T9SS type A sorting domain-containing protein [Candidatus Cloacimonadota bacterium]